MSFENPTGKEAEAAALAAWERSRLFSRTEKNIIVHAGYLAQATIKQSDIATTVNGFILAAKGEIPVFHIPTSTSVSLNELQEYYKTGLWKNETHFRRFTTLGVSDFLREWYMDIFAYSNNVDFQTLRDAVVDERAHSLSLVRAEKHVYIPDYATTKPRHIDSLAINCRTQRLFVPRLYHGASVHAVRKNMNNWIEKTKITDIQPVSVRSAMDLTQRILQS